jgi:DNA-binding transcriptional regulator/RsmH inhibitor MraZ
MIVAKQKIDNRGRIQIPFSLIKANNLENCIVEIETINSNKKSIRLTFVESKSE